MFIEIEKINHINRLGKCLRYQPVFTVKEDYKYLNQSDLIMYITNNILIQFMLSQHYTYKKLLMVDDFATQYILQNNTYKKEEVFLDNMFGIAELSYYAEFIVISLQQPREETLNLFEELLIQNKIPESILSITMHKDKHISMERRNSFYIYSKSNNCSDIKEDYALDSLFDNIYFRKYGILNTSGITLEKLNSNKYVNYIGSKVAKLYLSVFTFDNGTMDFKTMFWY